MLTASVPTVVSAPGVHGAGAGLPPAAGGATVRDSRRTTLIVVAVVVLAALGLGAVVFLNGDDTPATGSPGGSDPAVSTTIAGPGSTDPDSPTTAPQQEVTAAPTVPATVPPTTFPATAPPTTAFDPAATPTVPAVTRTSGPGSPQLLSNPLPSGVVYTDVAPSFSIAQQLADALANDDWATVRRLEAAKAGLSDAQLLQGYDGLDRASLLLVDARSEGAGYRLLVVSVANERNGARTSLFCLEWSVNPVAGSVVEHSSVVGRVAQVEFAISPEGVRNDAALDATVRSQCVWS
ncbi:MAG: hypothetical protein Q7V88_17555 [Actinomycetota bacterium]|nr:hypothetical protein [Actinomycetota bacterium]